MDESHTGVPSGAHVVHHVHEHDHDHDHDHDHEGHDEGHKGGHGHGGDYMQGLEGMLLGMMNRQGISDPAAMIAALKKDDSGMMNNPMWMLVLVFLFAMMFRGKGFGGDDGGERRHDGGYGYGYPLAQEFNYKTILDAVTAQGTRQEIAIRDLATNMNVDEQFIRSALCNLDKGVALLDGKIGYIDADIKGAIDRCCCNMRLEVERSTNLLSRELCGVNNNLQKDIFGMERNMDSKFCALERRMDDKFCQTQDLIVKTNYENRLREQDERIAGLKDQNFRYNQELQTLEILKAIKCEPRKVCFDERSPCDRDDRRDGGEVAELRAKLAALEFAGSQARQTDRILDAIQKIAPAGVDVE